MRTLLACVVPALLLAGCTASSSDPGEDLPSSTQATSGNPALAEVRLPVPMTLPVELAGNMGTFAHYCVFPAGYCDTHEVTPGVIDVIVEHPGSNFTGLDVNLTWTASSPANEQLVLGFMVMGECEGCDVTYEEVRGASPLRGTLGGQDVPLNETSVVHFYVYNPAAFQMLPGGAGYTFSSVDQDFRLEGVVHVVMP